MRDVYGIAAFRSRQQVLRFEDALRREGVSAGVMTTPRAVALGCGLSVQFELADLDRVRAALHAGKPRQSHRVVPRGAGPADAP